MVPGRAGGADADASMGGGMDDDGDSDGGGACNVLHRLWLHVSIVMLKPWQQLRWRAGPHCGVAREGGFLQCCAWVLCRLWQLALGCGCL